MFDPYICTHRDRCVRSCDREFIWMKVFLLVCICLHAFMRDLLVFASFLHDKSVTGSMFLSNDVCERACSWLQMSEPIGKRQNLSVCPSTEWPRAERKIFYTANSKSNLIISLYTCIDTHLHTHARTHIVCESVCVK